MSPSGMQVERLSLIVRPIELVVKVGTIQLGVTFFGAKLLSTEVIIFCNYCVFNVEVILPLSIHVEMDNGTITQIVRQPHGQQSKLSLLNEEENTSMTGWVRPPSKIQVTKRIVIQPDTQIWVEVDTKHDGLIMVDPESKLFTNQMCSFHTELLKSVATNQ